MVFALFDWEYPRSVLMQSGKLYKIGLKNSCFSSFIFWKWVFYGTLQSILLYFVSFYGFTYSISMTSGNGGDMLLEGMYIYGGVVILCNVQILFDSHLHSFYSLLFNFASTGSFYVIFYAMSLF